MRLLGSGPRAMIAGGVLALACGCSSDTSSSTTSTTTTAASPTTTLPAGNLAPISTLQVGACFDEVGDETATSFVVAVLPCAEPHALEVYDVQTYGGAQPPKAGSPYPGDLVVANAAETQCAGGFEAFMGLPWEASDFEIQTWWPTQQSWTRKNDRQIVCAVYKVTRDAVIGSVRGTRQ